jgi:hypothetical protein
LFVGIFAYRGVPATVLEMMAVAETAAQAIHDGFRCPLVVFGELWKCSFETLMFGFKEGVRLRL